MSEPAAPAPAHVPPPAGTTPGTALDALVELMRILRGPTGCPWDREQTLDTLLPFVLEEAHEVVEAIERRDLDELKGEIGDLVFEGVFLSQLCAETGDFTITDALNDVRAKLVRRHPHVFAPDAGTADVTTPDAVKDRWDAIKVVERAEKGRDAHQPDRRRARRPAGAAARRPDLGEGGQGRLRLAVGGAGAREDRRGDGGGPRRRSPAAIATHVAEEIGDLLFAVANLARKLDHDPEALLRAANRKFAARFRAMEARLADAGTPVGSDAASLDVMEAAWQAGKRGDGLVIVLTRRRFLGHSARVLATAAAWADGFPLDLLRAGAGRVDAAPLQTRPRFDRSPFTLGVASGDPTDDGVVLWTRLAPDPLAPGGGMPDEAVRVVWEVADDERFARIVARANTEASPLRAHAVHVEVDGLRPARPYWYRFRVGTWESPVGRTRTAPEPTADVDRVRLAFASCQHWEHGYFTAHRHLAREDLDVVLFLGDYIYEYARRPRIRCGR